MADIKPELDFYIDNKMEESRVITAIVGNLDSHPTPPRHHQHHQPHGTFAMMMQATSHFSLAWLSMSISANVLSLTIHPNLRPKMG